MITVAKAAGISTVFKPEEIIADFPILHRKVNGERLVYLDNAATTQKPLEVIEAVKQYYTKYNANVHRGLHTLSEEATAAYEEARRKAARFIGAVRTDEVIFTRGATESINLVAYSWGRTNIRKGDRIVLTHMEHHSNLVPWIELARQSGAELEYIPITDRGYLDLSQINDIITPNTKLVALTQMSNVLGTINPVEQVIDIAHNRGAVVLVDAAQSVPHMPVDVVAMGADFIAFSSHKMLGPTGIGVLYARRALLEEMPPFNYGGEMIGEVHYDHVSWAELPHKFEGGTPNIAGAVGFAPALDYLSSIGMDTVREHELRLTQYAIDKISRLSSIRIIGPLDASDRGGAVTFVDNDIHPHDMAQFLDTRGIAVRAGHHCAQPLHKRLGLNSSVRASFYIYNTEADIDMLVSAIKEARRYFGHE